MLKLIKADLFRIRKSKAFWISFLGLISVGVLFVISQSNIQFFSSPEAMDAMGDQNQKVWTGIAALQNLSQMSYMLSFFFIPCFTILFNQDILKQTYKNVIAHNITRTKYFFSKLTIIIVMALFMFISFLVASFLVASLLNGVGTLDTEIIFGLMSTYGLQFLVIMAWQSLILMILITTHSTILSVIVVGFAPFFLYIIAQLMNMPDLLKVNPLALTELLAEVTNDAETLKIVFTFILGCFGISTILSLVTFNKQDLK